MKKILKINLFIAVIISINAIILYIFLEDKYSIEHMSIIFIVMLIGSFVILNIAYLPVYIVKVFLLLKKRINKQYIDLKESIYTRELPQQYNSVIAGEIFEFKSSFKDEYVAGTVELISKGYIIEQAGELFINSEKSTEGLLKNEKYILETCTKINKDVYWKYQYIFFEKTKEDMFDLGLYKKDNFLYKIKKKIIKFLEKTDNTVEIINISSKILLIILILSLISNFKLTISIIIVTYIMILVLKRKSKLTSKGEIEKEKIGKLKLYFDKETDFKNKTEEERKVWGRYTAFAIALGSNKEIKEEIFKKYFKYRK